MLRVLRLARNTLSGTLPPTWGRPEVFSWLEVLDLSHNALTGRLHAAAVDALPQHDPSGAAAHYCTRPPTAAGGSTSLHLLHDRPSGHWVAFRLLAFFPAGPLPSQWSFQNLENLSLAHNQLTGAIPLSWGYRTTFPDLRHL